MARVVLTGATGFVGGRLAARLRRDGHQVVACVRRASADLAALEVVQVDGGLEAVTAELVADSAVVVHVAATAGPDLATARAVNVDGTARVVAAVRTARVPRLVHVSTTAVYVRPRDDRAALDEDSATVDPGDPEASPYAATKAAAEQLVLDADLPSTTAMILRPPAVLGAGATSTWGRRIPERIRAGEGPPAARDSTFGFVHIEDLVDALVAAAGRSDPAAAPLVANVVGGHVSVGTYLDAVVALLPDLPGQRPGRDDTGWRGTYATDRLPALLGVRPHRSFEDAMAEIARDWTDRR